MPKISLFLILTTMLLSVFFSATAQKKGDSKIIITVSDTAGLHNKVRMALIKQDFVIKELGLPDSITTYRRELKSTTGVTVAFAKIDSNVVTIHAIWSQKIKDLAGLSVQENKFKKIMYFKGSKLWPLMQSIADYIGGDHAYSD
jgi:hypothetical protein